MKMRKEYKLPSDPEKLTTRQMEFIELLSKRESEIESKRLESKMTSEHRMYVRITAIISTAVLIFLIAAISLWHRASVLGTENAMKYGYEMTGRMGTSSLYWTKIDSIGATNESK